MAATGAHRKSGAIILGGTHGSLSVARSLGSRGIPVWLIETSRSLAGFSRYVEKRLTWDGPEAHGALDWLFDLAERHDIGSWILFPAADPETRFIAENHARLASRFRLTTLPWDILKQAQDKNLLYQRAAELGLAHPKSYYPDTLSGIPNPERFPVVIKPTMREDNNPLTAAKAWRADNQADYERLYREARRFLPLADIVVQEMIPGTGETQFSYTGLWHRGRPIASMIARRTRQYALTFGTGTFVEAVDNPEIEEIAVRLLESFDYHGLVEAEFKYDERDGLYKVLDVNTRIWTWIGLGEAAGVDFPWLAWRAEMGDVPEAARGRPGASWRYLPRDVLAGVLEMRSGTSSVGDFLTSFLRKSAAASFAWDDPLPGLVDLPLAFLRIFPRLIAMRQA
ncbi:MAG: ATP-grasp domain-containing protein [Parvibaculaceae bacterium]